ncbi:MAG: rod shape-determining protein MreC [Clostridiaceae bacterium]|nr:rod shape-determining protein MreC [Clostridiaceae bacterium]
MRRIFTNKIFVFSLIVVLLLTLAAVSYNEKNGVNVISNIISIPAVPFQKAVTFMDEKISDFFGYFEDIKKTKAENEELRQRINELEQEILDIEKLKKENRELRDVLNYKNQYEEYEFLGSSIIAKDPGNWFDVFTIDRGSKDQITVDSPVVTAYGLVGRISKIDAFSSKVVSIIDMDSTVSARLSKSRDLIVVRGDLELRNQGQCRADYIPPDADVQPGDTVETSGIGGIFPKGIVIGKVVKVVKNEGQYDSYAIIEPVVDFKRLEEVIVLKKK